MSDFGKSFGWKSSEAVESANGGERRYTLDEKNTGLQKGNRYGHFEGRTAQAGGVRNKGKEKRYQVSFVTLCATRFAVRQPRV